MLKTRLQACLTHTKRVSANHAAEFLAEIRRTQSVS